LKILFPNYEKFASDIMTIREKEIKEEAKGGNDSAT